MRIDCSNLACPEPVIRTKNALLDLNENESLEVIVDNEAARENVKRFAKTQNYDAKVSEKDGKFHLVLSKDCGCEIMEFKQDKMLFLKDDKVGSGELGDMLVAGFLQTLLEIKNPPKQIFCVNKAVFLTTGSNEKALVALKELEKRGVEIFSCGVCLEFYKLKNDLKVGQIGNSYQILNELFSNETISL